MDSSSWIFEWVSEEKKVKCSAQEFMECLDFPWFEGKGTECHMHCCDEITDEQLHMSMDPNKVGDVSSSNPNPRNLDFNHQAYYQILVKTLCPTICPRKITGVLRNTLFAISCCVMFDVEDLFLRNLVDAAKIVLSPKIYAPWIQKVINLACG